MSDKTTSYPPDSSYSDPVFNLMIQLQCMLPISTKIF